MASPSAILLRWLPQALRWTVLVALAAAGVVAQRLAPGPGEPDRTSGPWARSARAAVEPSARELSSLRRAPSHAVELPFRVTVTVHRVGAEWNAYLTRFVPESHLRLEVWSDDQFPWRSQDFAASAPYVFVPRGTPLEPTAAALAPYDRVVVEGFVRQVFAGEPWIELSAIEPADVSLTEATVFHAARAIDLASRGLEDLACNELDHALAAPMPQRHRDELERLRADYAAPAEER
jgi:hypothetical protein